MSNSIVKVNKTENFILLLQSSFKGLFLQAELANRNRYTSSYSQNTRPNLGKNNWSATMKSLLLKAHYKEEEEERWQVKDLLQRPPDRGVGMSAQTFPCLSLNTGHYPHKPPREPLCPGVKIQRPPSYLCHNLHMSLSSLRWSRGALKYTGHINTTPPKPAESLPVTECGTNHCSQC